MGSQLMLAVKYKDETALISGTLMETVDNIRSCICGKWSELCGFDFVLHCNVGKIQNCPLNSNDDLHNAIALTSRFDVQVIDVNVSVKPSMGKEPSHTIPEFNSSQFLNDKSSKQGDYGQSETAYHMYSSFDFTALDGSGTSNVINRGDQDEYVGICKPPAFNICPDLSVTPLLSLKWKEALTGVGQVFRGGREEFRTELIKYATYHSFRFEYSKNGVNYVYANCSKKSNGCQWFFRSKQFQFTGYFEITKCSLTHGCSGKIMKPDSRRLGPKIWGSLLLENVKAKPEKPGKAMKTHMQVAYGVQVQYNKAWRAVEVAKNHIYGTYNKSFNLMIRYCKATINTNPGSHAFVEPDEKTKKFKSSFFALNACLEGFKDCRPMISIDGTHMYGRWRGVILSATGKDGNNGLFPLAIALVASEDLDNWVWFLSNLRDMVKHDKQIFYLSDRNSGLMSAFPLVFANPCHFYCLFHLHNNLKAFFSGPWTTAHRKGMCELLTECAYAPNVLCFQESMQKFLTAGRGLGQKFMENLEPEFWAYAYSPNIVRYREMTSNASESLNNSMQIARGLPVTHMVETVRAGIMRWFVERKREAETWTSVLCTRRQDIWNHNRECSRQWMVTDCPDGKLMVDASISVVVNIEKRTCSCHQWQIHGFPCAHATAAIIHKECSIFDVIDPCFFTETYVRAYSPIMYPIPGTALLEAENMSDEEVILPPLIKNTPGRPKNKRKKSYREVPKQKLNICPVCHKKSRHDPLTCKIQPPKKKQKSSAGDT